jgi:archaetidylinositol phosphate synthase
MLDRLRARLAGTLTLLGKAFSSVSASPTSWTFVGFALSALAALAFSYGGYPAAATGGALVLASGFFDVVDGAVARVGGRSSKRGAFLDSTLDRVSEVFIYGGLLAGGYADAVAGHSWGPLLVLVALAASLLVSYTRAKGESLGVSLSGRGVGERSERLLVLALASLAGLTGWGVAAVSVIAVMTFLERVAISARAL